MLKQDVEAPNAIQRNRRLWRWIGRRLFAWSVAIGVVMIGLRLTGRAERLFFQPTQEPTPAPQAFAGARMVDINSRDGTRLRGWFIPSQTTPAELSPTLLQVHGNGGNILSHLGFVDYLPGHGFNLFMFDYRGYGESDGHTTSRQSALQDANAALDVLLQQPEINPNRIGLVAQSLGGAVGLSLMADRPELRAAAIESPFASWQFAASTALGGADPNFFAVALAWILIPDSDRPDDAIRRIHRPILLHHGDADTTIPHIHSQLLRDAAAQDVELHILSGGQHNTLRDTHPEIEKRIVEFLRSNLP